MNLIPAKIDSSDAPYLVDYIREGLLRDFSDDALINDSLSIYTTIDPELQSAAVEAVNKGLKAVEEHSGTALQGKEGRGQTAASAGGNDRNGTQHRRHRRHGWRKRLRRQPVQSNYVRRSGSPDPFSSPLFTQPQLKLRSQSLEQ